MACAVFESLSRASADTAPAGIRIARSTMVRLGAASHECQANTRRRRAPPPPCARPPGPGTLGVALILGERSVEPRAVGHRGPSLPLDGERPRARGGGRGPPGGAGAPLLAVGR